MSFARRMPPFIAGLIGVGSGFYIFYPSVQQLQQAPSHPPGMAQNSQPPSPPSTTDSVAIQSDSPSGPKSESPSSKRA